MKKKGWLKHFKSVLGSSLTRYQNNVLGSRSCGHILLSACGPSNNLASHRIESKVQTRSWKITIGATFLWCTKNFSCGLRNTKHGGNASFICILRGSLDLKSLLLVESHNWLNFCSCIFSLNGSATRLVNEVTSRPVRNSYTSWRHCIIHEFGHKVLREEKKRQNHSVVGLKTALAEVWGWKAQWDLRAHCHVEGRVFQRGECPCFPSTLYSPCRNKNTICINGHN